MKGREGWEEGEREGGEEGEREGGGRRVRGREEALSVCSTAFNMIVHVRQTVW